MRWWNAIVLGAVVVVAAAAAVDGLRGRAAARPAAGSSPAANLADDRLQGPDVPAAGALPGALVLAEPGSCRLRTLDLGTVVVGEAGPETGCELWASPADGRAVVTTAPASSNPQNPRPLALVRLGERPETEDGDLGQALGAVAWSRDGSRVAWCGPDHETVVLEIESRSERRVPGCSPAFADDGNVLTIPANPLDARLLREGETLLTEDDLVRGIEPATTAPIQVAAFAVAPGGRLAVSVLVFEALGSVIYLELWNEGMLEASFRVPTVYGTGSSRLGQHLAFSPDGNELAVGFRAGPGDISILDLRLSDVTMNRVDQRGFAWSPDGVWLAIATEGEVDVYGDTRDEPIYTLPLSTASLGWAGPAGSGPGDGG